MQFLRQWDEEESFKRISKANQLKVTWGSYKDEAQTVFYYESQLATQEQFEKLLQHKKRDALVFTNWREIEMKNVQIMYKDLTAAFFKKAHIEQSTMIQSWASGTNFKEATLINFKFKACDLKLSDFTKGYLKNVCFEECNLDTVCFHETQFIGVIMIHNGIHREIKKKEDLIYL